MATINWLEAGEPLVGKDSPDLPDTLNRALRQVLSISGYDPDGDAFEGFADSADLTTLETDLTDEIADRIAAIATEAAARIAGDAATLASANAHSDGIVTTEAAARVAGDAASLASANAHSDGIVTTEAAARVAGDAASLASANAHSDAYLHTSVGTVAVGTWNAGVIATTYGGTGLAGYAAGDTVYYAAGALLSKLAIGTANKILTSSGAAPQWSTTIVYAALPTGNGSWDTGAGTTITVTRSLTVSGTLTGTLTGSISGNAATATALATPRAINGVNFDGTAPITVTAAAGTLSGATLAANVLASSLTSVGTLSAGAVPASLVTAGTFGAGAYAFQSTVSLTGLTFTTSVTSTTALATPSAFVATTASHFASTVSGAVTMGYGTTFDVTLKNRAGTDVLGIGPNTTTVTTAGALVIAGAISANATTESSSAATGSIIVAGGVGIAKALFVGGANGITASAGTDATSFLIVGSGGSSPTTTRAARLVMNTPHGGSGTGSAYITVQRAGVGVWNVGLDSVVSGAKGANTDWFWQELSGNNYRMALSAAGALTIQAGFTATTGTFTANVVTSGSFEFQAYGLGVAGGTNTEFLRLYHNGSGSGAYLVVAKAGTGAYADLIFNLGGINRVTFSQAGTVTFAGQVTVQGNLAMNTTSSINTQGTWGYNSTFGSYIMGKAGSQNDITLFNKDGNAVLHNPTGTVNMTFPGTLGVTGLITASAGVTIAAGQDLKLGNAYTAGVQVPSGYIVIKDSTGTAYKVSCNL